MIWERLFWWALTFLCVGWYGTITVYVAVKGFSDIKRMLKQLGRVAGDSSQPDSAPASGNATAASESPKKQSHC